MQPHNLAPQHRGRGGARPRALPAPQRRRLGRDTWLSAPGAPGRPRPPASRTPRCSGCGAEADSPRREGVPPPSTRPREPSTAQARRPVAGQHPRLSAHSRAAGHDSTKSAAARGPRGPRGCRGASSRSAADKAQPRQHMERRKWRRGRGLLSGSPGQRALLPLGIHFPEKPVSPRAALPQAPSTMSPSSPPRPGCRRSLPPRGAGAEESCPTGSGGGERVLAAPCVRREWSCCKMAAEAHAAGSKPDPVPLASERAPSARARPRVTPLPSPPWRVRFSHSLPQPLPSYSSSFSPCHLRRPLAALSSRPSSFLPCTSSPSFPTPVRGRSDTSGRPSPRWLSGSRPPSLALSARPQSLPSRSFSLPR